MAAPPMLDRPTAARTRPDPIVALTVVLLTVSVIGLTLGGILAIYDWRTPGAEMPLFYSVLGTFFAAVALLVVGAAVRWARRGLR